MQTIVLVIESAKDGEFWGRVQYDDNLIVENASTVPKLERKMKTLLKTGMNLTRIRLNLTCNMISQDCSMKGNFKRVL